MALTETQLLSLSEILNTDTLIIDAYVKALEDAGRLTAERINRLDSQIARWQEVKDDFYEIEPTGANRGFRLSSDAVKRDIRQTILTLLDMPRLVSNVRTVRVAMR